MAENASRIAICDLNDVRDDLKIASDDTSYDERIRRLISGVSKAVESYTGRKFVARDVVTEKYDGDGTIELLLRTAPIISVDALVVDTITVTSAQYVVYNEIGKVTMIDGGVFTLGPQSVSISYRCGYERQDLPEDVSMGARIWVCHLFKIADKQRWGVQSSSAQDESYSFESGAMPAEVKQVFDMYRIWR